MFSFSVFCKGSCVNRRVSYIASFISQSASSKNELYFIRAKLDNERDNSYMQSFCRVVSRKPVSYAGKAQGQFRRRASIFLYFCKDYLDVLG